MEQGQRGGEYGKGKEARGFIDHLPLFLATRIHNNKYPSPSCLYSSTHSTTQQLIKKSIQITNYNRLVLPPIAFIHQSAFMRIQTTTPTKTAKSSGIFVRDHAFMTMRYECFYVDNPVRVRRRECLNTVSLVLKRFYITPNTAQNAK